MTGLLQFRSPKLANCDRESANADCRNCYGYGKIILNEFVILENLTLLSKAVALEDDLKQHKRELSALIDKISRYWYNGMRYKAEYDYGVFQVSNLKGVYNHSPGNVVSRADDGLTIKKVQIDHHRQQIILQPFNIDYPVLVLDSDWNYGAFLIGTIALQLRFF